MRHPMLAVALMGLLVPASLGQGKTPPPKDNPEVPALIDKLEPVIRGKPAGDSEGTQILDKLSTLYPTLNSGQQKAVVKAVADCFKANRKPTEVPLYLSAGEALSRFGRDGADALAKVVQDRRFKYKSEWSEFRAMMIRLLGRPSESRHIKLLLDIASRDEDNQARAKAGEALGDYAGHDQKERKDIVGELVKSIEEVYSKAKENLDPNDLNRKVWSDRYAAIEGPWMKTLGKLTGQNFKEVIDWRRWYNKNKRENWDKGKAPGGG